MIIGEAPAWRKERDKPFQGEAGKILDQALDACGVSRDEVYITNIVKCRPPENRSPKSSEIEACKDNMEWEAVAPQFVLLLGTSAARLLGKGKVSVSEVRGKFYAGKGRIYSVTMHPGAVLRDPHKLPLFIADVRAFFDKAKGTSLPRMVPLSIKICNSAEDLEQLYADLANAKRIAFDIETTTLFPWEAGAKVLTLGFGLEDCQYIVPVNHKSGFLRSSLEQQKVMAKHITEILNDKSIICHNGKFDALWVKVHLGMDIHVNHDTMMITHLLDENTPHGLKYLAEVWFCAKNYDLSLEEKTGGASLEKLAEYNAYDVYYTRLLYNKFMPKLKEDPALYAFYKKVIMPAVNTFIEIEYHGVYVDSEKLKEVKLYLQAEIARLAKELQVYKKDVNWNSTQQLGEFLYKDLHLPILDTTPKGSPATSEGVLQRLDHPAVKLIMKYRETYKMLGTFVTSWTEKKINSRLHPSFKLHGTVTGRLSCEEPNLQQVPRDPTLRSLVTAPEGFTFVEADFSQVELRIAAMLSSDVYMREAFATGEDIHTKTAELVSGKSLGKMEDFEAKEWRKKAKAINFGFLYGMGAKKFQDYARDKYQVGFTIPESQVIREKFFTQYSGLQPWYKRQERIAELNGYVRSPSGRLRHLPSIHSHDDYERSQAIRQAINSPVQGFASDLTLMAVVDIHRMLPQVKIVGTVHDSILMEIPTVMVEETLPLIKQIMESPPTLKELGVVLTVPIQVEISLGNWGGGKKWIPGQKQES
jgi:DNA polymerase-1